MASEETLAKEDTKEDTIEPLANTSLDSSQPPELSPQTSSPDLAIAFLILLALGISIYYNQSTQEQGASRFNYKERNTLATVKGDDNSLFSSWN